MLTYGQKRQLYDGFILLRTLCWKVEIIFVEHICIESQVTLVLRLLGVEITLLFLSLGSLSWLLLKGSICIQR